MTRILMLMFFCSCCGVSSAEPPTVYRVLADDSKLTGFKLQNTPGIITALHGVVGKRNIRAISSSDLKPHLDLKIVMVDLVRDLAVVSNSELAVVNDHGLVLAKQPNWIAGEKLTIIGYPKEVTFAELKTKVELRDPPQCPLRALVGPEKLIALQERSSPNPELLVANIQGEILPGHSGAPIVNANQEVIAVGNGGLFDEIGWGIPVQQVEWTTIEKIDPATFNRLQKRSGLFQEIRILGSPIKLELVEDKEGSTTAKASGKVCWLPNEEGIRVDLKLYVRKSGINGTGYAFARVDLLDASGNTVWSTPVWRKHKGASVIKGISEGEDDFDAIAPASLRNTVTNAVLSVRANDSDGLSADLEKFFEKVGSEVQKGNLERRFAQLFPL